MSKGCAGPGYCECPACDFIEPSDPHYQEDDYAPASYSTRRDESFIAWSGDHPDDDPADFRDYDPLDSED